MAAVDQTPGPPSAGVVDSSASSVARIVDATLHLATSWVGELTAYVLAIASTGYAFKKLEPALKGFPPSVQIAIVAVPLVFALLLQATPKILAWKRRRLLTRIPGHLQPGYFQLAPRDERTAFDRADGKHLEILHWVSETKCPVLYLTGLSGSGKTSLLAAWVVPKLRSDSHVVIRLRGYQDPVTALEQQLQEPGVIWQKPDAQRLDIRTLVERASRHVRGKRLLIIFDQFEEFVILRDASQQQRFNELISLFKEHPRGDITFLFVFRSDYIGLIEKLGLPPLQQDTNWEEVPPFTETAAREFMKSSGLPAGEELQAEVLREAAEIEQTKGLIRPITINLCGLVLGRFAAGLPHGFRPGQLIRGFLKESIFLSPIRDTSPRILPHLISSYVTRRPRTLAALSRETGLEADAIRGCLRVLGKSDRAIVRPLDANQETWEISHDFLVPLLDSILARSTVSFWRRYSAWLPWMVAVGLLVLSATMPYWLRGPVAGTIFQAKIILCKGKQDCIVQAISALPSKVKSKNDTPSEQFYADQELGEFIRSSDDAMKVLGRIYGVRKEAFLGTGFSEPNQLSSGEEERIPEYLVPNYFEMHRGLLVWKLGPLSAQDAKTTVIDVVNKNQPLNPISQDEYLRTREAAAAEFLPGHRSPVVRFAWIPPAKYSHCLGRPEAHKVFASHLGMMSRFTVQDAVNMSGLTPRQPDDELYMFILVPQDDTDISPATWNYMVSHVSSELKLSSVCALRQ